MKFTITKGLFQPCALPYTILSKPFGSFLILFFLYASTTLAQDTLNVDKAFMRARELAFNGKKAEARSLGRRILRKSPGYTDVHILIGRTYTWDKQYDSARVVLRPLAQTTPPVADALSALVDLEIWSDNPQQALIYADQALALNPTATNIQEKKIQALINLKDYATARELSDNLLKTNPGNGDVLRLANIIRNKSNLNSISVSLQQDWFNQKFDSWQSATVAYARQTSLLGTLTGRANYARRFNTNGIQIETDMFPKIGKKMYAYLNAGFSSNSLFPTFRSGLSLYRSLPKSFEAELGIRYLSFNNNTFIYTGSISKYLGSFYFSFRPFITPNNQQLSQSYFLVTRYYLNSATDFITLTLGSGLSPDDNTKDVALIEVNTLQSRKVRLDFQKNIAAQTSASLLLGFDQQEFKPNTFRNNTTLNIGIQQSF